MKMLFSRSIDPTISSGPIAQRDLQRDGYISVVFYVTDRTIGVDIAGCSTFHQYFFNPKYDRIVIKNKNFVESIVEKTINPQAVKDALGIK